jgi:hypothetical protein
MLVARRHLEAGRRKPDRASAEGGERGYDKRERVAGRKRHIVVDRMGLLLTVVVHCASEQDRDGFKPLTAGIKARSPRLKLLRAEGTCGAAAG